MGIRTWLASGWTAVVITAALAAGAAADCGGGCGGSLAGTPADEFVAARIGLVREWVVQVPFDSARAELTHVVVGDGLVVAQTGDGGVHAVQAAPFSAATSPRPGAPANGTLRWSRHIGPTGGHYGPATPPGVGPRLVTVARDRELFAVDRDTGAARWQTPLATLAAAGAVEIGDWAYAPLQGGGIRRLTFDPYQPTVNTTADKPVAAKRPKGGKKKVVEAVKPTPESLRPRTFDGGGRVDRPVRALQKGVFWTTTDGVLVTLQPTDLEWVRLEFALNAPAVDTPITRGGSVFAATAAADLARVDLVETGVRGLRTGWHVVLDAVPDAGPFLSGDTVVVSLGEAGLAAFSAETGAALWRSPTAGRVLAVAGDRVWIIDRTERLTGLDLATGVRRERLCLGGFSFPVVNAESDRLILASPDGLLVSLAPRTPAAAAPEPAQPAAPAPRQP